MQTALARITREVGARRRDPSGQSNMMMMMFSLLGQKKLRDDLAGHTHTGSDAKAVLPTTGSSSSLTSILPFILLMQPNAFGGSTAGQDNNAMGGLLPFLLISTILD